MAASGASSGGLGDGVSLTRIPIRVLRPVPVELPPRPPRLLAVPIAGASGGSTVCVAPAVQGQDVSAFAFA